jgi:endonuclease III
MTLNDYIVRIEAFYGLLLSPPSEPFQLFVWEVLFPQAPPARRDAAFAALKGARVLTPDAMRRAPQATLEAALKLISPYFEQRLEGLRSGADVFRRHPELAAATKGPLGLARRALQHLPPLPDGGTRRMLLFAGNHLVLPVDVRVQRVARRLGLGAPGSRPRSIHRALTKELAPDVETYRRAFLYLSHHGASTCTEADPHCSVCPLLPDCQYGKQRLQI